MAKAMASGSATSPTVRPATASARNERAVYPRRQLMDLGSSEPLGSLMAPLSRAGDLPQHTHRLFEMGLEIALHRVKHLDQHGIAQGVPDLVAFLARGDQAPGAQQAEVLGKIGRLDADAFEQRAHGERAVAQ